MLHIRYGYFGELKFWNISGGLTLYFVLVIVCLICIFNHVCVSGACARLLVVCVCAFEM